MIPARASFFGASGRRREKGEREKGKDEVESRNTSISSFPFSLFPSPRQSILLHPRNHADFLVAAVERNATEAVIIGNDEERRVLRHVAAADVELMAALAAVVVL